MNADDYQKLAGRTFIGVPDSEYSGEQIMLVWYALGLAGEAGEVADTAFTNEEIAIMLGALELGAAVGKALDYVKKGIAHRHGFNSRELHNLLAEMAIADINLRVTSVGMYAAPEYRLTGNEQMLIWCALGLGGEAGEVMEGASMVQYGKISTQEMVKEAGDVSWYLAAICTLLGVSMSDVMQSNITKLEKRYKNGYSSEESKARVDTV